MTADGSQPEPQDLDRRIRLAFAEAVDLPADGRAHILAQLSLHDSGAADELRQLLEAHDQAGVLDHAPTELSAAMRGESTQADASATPSLPRLDDPISAGVSVAECTIVKMLGSGSMATTYLAQRGAGAAWVTIKLIRPELVDGPMIRRFREFPPPQDWRLPGIASPLEIGVATGAGAVTRPYIVSQFVAGESLHRMLAAGLIDLRSRLLLVERLARTLDAVHQRGLVHTRLSTRSIIIEKITDGLSPWILDLGLAGLTAPVSAVPELTRPSSHSTDEDLRALGAILFECFAGRVPPLSPDVVDWSDFAGRSGPMAADITRRAMLSGETGGFQSAAEMRDSLSALSSRPAWNTQSPRWRDRLKRWISG